jgi:hypothetical protein
VAAWFLKRDETETDAFAVSGWREGIFRVTDQGTVFSPWRRMVAIAPQSLQARMDGRKADVFLAEIQEAVQVVKRTQEINRVSRGRRGGAGKARLSKAADCRLEVGRR